MEKVCPDLIEKHIALFSDNTPTVSWVTWLTSKKSLVAELLVRALALCLKKMTHTCPLTPLHIAGSQNAMTDIPSHSFGSNPLWHCKTDKDLLTLFANKFPTPPQTSWTAFRPSSKICTRLILLLQMKHTSLDEWRQLPNIGNHIGNIGTPTLNLWDWTLTFRTLPSTTESAQSQDSQAELEEDTTATNTKSELA